MLLYLAAMRTDPAVSPQNLVIIVDDDEAVRRSLEFSLELDGYAVRTYAEPGQLLAEQDFPRRGCLVLDYHLPDTNGLALLDVLRKRGMTIPAILITSAPAPAIAARAAAGGVPIVEKPFLGNKLNDAVRAAFELPAPSVG